MIVIRKGEGTVCCGFLNLASLRHRQIILIHSFIYSVFHWTHKEYSRRLRSLSLTQFTQSTSFPENDLPSGKLS